MASKRSKWLIGCGAGCGLIVIAAIAVVLAVSVYVGRSLEGVRDAERSYREWTSRYGEVEDFAPAPDGAIPAERIEIFLSVREALGGTQRELGRQFADFPPDDLLREKRVFFAIFRAVRGIAALINPISSYVDQRQRLLLEAGMGPGEYVYIYATAYYSWLGRPPGEGPRITKQTGGEMRKAGGDPLFAEADSPYNADRVRRRYRRYTLILLGNQLAALPGPDGGPGSDEWRARLEAEIRRFESRPDRVAWQEGLPPAVAASLEPFRARFEATWDGATNPFELPLLETEHWGRGGD